VGKLPKLGNGPYDLGTELVRIVNGTKSLDTHEMTLVVVVGPCALEFTRMKTPDHYWTDPSADELVQRHRIHSSATPHYIPANSESPRRPALQVWSPLLTCSLSEVAGALHFQVAVVSW